MEKCSKCFNRRSIVSENGMHYNCCLKEKDAMDCIMGRVDHYLENPMKRDRTE